MKARAFTGGVSFDCAVQSELGKPDAYAYVRPDRSFAIVLAAFFWNAPDLGFDSKPGVIVHELTHFLLVGATRDLAYGTIAAKALATLNPAGARRNADNYEYFAEVTAFGLR